MSLHTVSHKSCPIHLSFQSGSGDVQYLFIHGFLAHTGWWQWILPHIPQDIWAMDISGMGDSGHREAYIPEDSIDEVRAVCDYIQSQSDKPIVIVGHSFGGGLAIYHAARHPKGIARVVTLDTALPPFPMKPSETRPSVEQKKRFYSTVENALQRFRLIPNETVAPQDVLDAIAREGLKEIEGGYTWKFDPKRISDPAVVRPFWNGVLKAAQSLEMPLHICRGAQSSLCTVQWEQALRSVLNAEYHTIDNAMHHVILDNPMGCVGVL